jgi:sarcosine oxidase
MIWLDPISAPERFAPGRQPYWIWEGAGQVGYGHPAVDGPTAGVKAGMHSGGDPASPDTLDRQVRDEEVEAVRLFLADRIPQLAGRCLRSRVCMYDNTPDLGFVIGPAPTDQRIIVAGGTSGHGFKFVPAIGEAVADLVSRGRASQDLSLFDPRRFLARKDDHAADLGHSVSWTHPRAEAGAGGGDDLGHRPDLQRPAR